MGASTRNWEEHGRARPKWVCGSNLRQELSVGFHSLSDLTCMDLFMMSEGCYSLLLWDERRLSVHSPDEGPYVSMKRFVEKAL